MNKDSSKKVSSTIEYKSFMDRLQNLIQKSVERENEEVVLKQSKTWSSIITWTLMGGTVLAIGWLAIAKTEEIVVASGKLEPISDVVEIQMPLQGIAEIIKIKEGDKVKQGEVLILLDTEASKDRYKAILETIKLKKSEIQYKKAERESIINNKNTRVNSYEKSLKLAMEILSRLEVLVKQGASSELQYLEQRDKIQKIKGEINQLEGDAERQLSINNQNLQNLKAQISQLNSDATEASVTLKYQELTSPVDGIVFDLQATAPGFVARTSEPILKIVPIDKLQAKVDIESRSIGFVKVGIPTDISIDSFPSTDFGVVHGKIKSISSDVLPPEAGTNKGYRFPTNISLDSQDLVLKNGRKLPLQVGMSLTANIKLRKVTYLQLLLGSFRDKADSLRSL